MNHKTYYVDEEVFASKGKRFSTYLIDFVAVYIISFLIGIIATILYIAFKWDTLLIWIANMDLFRRLLFGALINIFYFGLSETFSGRTLGKLICGTKVIMEDGSRPSTTVIFMRTLCRLIPFEAFTFLGETGRGWHDTLSDTYVVDVSKYNEAVRRHNSIDEIGQQPIEIV